MTEENTNLNDQDQAEAIADQLLREIDLLTEKSPLEMARECAKIPLPTISHYEVMGENPEQLDANEELEEEEGQSPFAPRDSDRWRGIEHQRRTSGIWVYEPNGYPSLYNNEFLAKAGTERFFDPRFLMPKQPRLEWLVNPKNWSVLSTNDDVASVVATEGACEWFSACLASVGGFFVVLHPEADDESWESLIVVPTTVGDASARMVARLKAGDGYNTVLQYIFEGDPGARVGEGPVHTYMLNHLARMLTTTNPAIKQALSTERLVSTLREGLNDPALRVYANIPSFFTAMFLTSSADQHRADSTYNSNGWTTRVSSRVGVLNRAITHYNMVMAMEVEEDLEIYSREWAARAMMLSMRQRIMTMPDVRNARKQMHR